MKIEEIKKCPQRNGYYIVFSGTSNCNGVKINWQAIPVKDVFSSYFYMENIEVGKEEKTSKYDKRGIFDFFSTKKRVARWHAAEHKIINLLVNDIPLTLGESKKSSAISYKCGIKNDLLANPTDSQLLEVLEVGKKIKKQIENSPLFFF